MRRIISLLAVLLLCGSVNAQVPMTGAGLGAPSSGGGGASIAAITANSNICGVSPCTVISGQTFSAGVVAFGVATSIGGGNTAATSAQITGLTGGTVTATQIGSSLTDTSSTTVQMWYAVLTSGGTGNIVLSTTGAIGLTCFSAWAVTGYSSSTPSNNFFNGLVSTQADPQGPMSSITIASGGVGAFFIGGTFHTATANPTTWVQSARDVATETGNAGGNGCAVAGSHISAAGTYTGITASGSVSWLYSGMIGATWH